MPINCFTRWKRPDLQEKFEEKLKQGKHEMVAARETILEEHEAMHNRFNDARKILGVKKAPYQRQETPDIESINNQKLETDASTIRSDQGQPSEQGDVNRASQNGGGENIQQTPGVQPQPPGTEQQTKPGGEGGNAQENQGGSPKIPAEPPTNPDLSSDEPNDPQMTKMANWVNDAFIEGKFGTAALDQVISKLQDTDLKAIWEKAKARIAVSGAKFLDDTRERLITTKHGSEEDQAVLLYDLAEMKGREGELQKSIISEQDPKKVEELQNDLKVLENKMQDNALANRYIGRSASNIFRLRQLWVNRDLSIQDMEQQYQAARNIKNLSDEDRAYIKGKYQAMQDAKAKLAIARDALEKAQSENTRLAQENEALQNLKNMASRQRKADRALKNEEAIARSNDRIKKAKDDLKNLGGTLQASILPFNPQAAILLSKIAAEKIYQGVVRFDELVRNVFDEVKDALPNWTEKDIANHLLTKTDKNGNPINQDLAARYEASKINARKSDKAMKERVNAYKSAQKEMATKQFEWMKENRFEMMKNRPILERIGDAILRWQRFAILSYPTTLLKLAAVVGHGLILKPFRFGLQALFSKIPGISDKASIWGDPHLSSIGAYYAAFIRNFALSNLKEHFKGIDTNEMLYGKPMMYDEWNAGRGLLEIPGRLHGYIKSFLKNPEFQYAHNQQMLYHMAEMQKALKTDDKARFQEHDVTSEDVIEKINKMSLEHGKWAILMNDSKFTQAWNKFVNSKGLGGLGVLLKSELPIVKIPINYLSRYFVTKYGLIASLTGRAEMMPSVIKVIRGGSKGLSEDQANLLGRTLNLGSMGAAFYLMGYWLHGKIKQNEDGSAEVFGHHVSKYLLHSPEFSSIFSGATTANKFQEKSPHDLKNWALSYAQSEFEVLKNNPFNQMLAYGFMPNVARVLADKKDPDKKLDKVESAIFQKVADMAIPGFIKQPSGWLDTGKPGMHPTGQVIKRKPTGGDLERFWQTLELGTPLRKNVPTAKESKQAGQAASESYKNKPFKEANQ